MHFEAFRAAPTKQQLENKQFKKLRQTASVAQFATRHSMENCVNPFPAKMQRQKSVLKTLSKSKMSQSHSSLPFLSQSQWKKKTNSPTSKSIGSCNDFDVQSMSVEDIIKYYVPKQSKPYKTSKKKEFSS